MKKDDSLAGAAAIFGAVVLALVLLALTGCSSRQATTGTRWVAYKQTVGSYDGARTPEAYMLVDRDTGVTYLVAGDAITPIYDKDGKVKVMDE